MGTSKSSTVCLSLLMLLTSPLSANQAHNQLTPTESASGWQLLFDGKTLAHWRTYKKSLPNPQWQAIDGELTLTRGGGGDLLTENAWSNFELHLDWKVSQGGNSGVFFLADESGKRIYSKAAEVQILDDARHADNKIATHRSGSLYDLIAAPAVSQLPAGEWNKVVITHNNRHLQVWQNSVQTVDIVIGGLRWNVLVDDSKFSGWDGFGALTSGHIGLQDHGDVVAFRNLKIRSLTESP